MATLLFLVMMFSLMCSGALGNRLLRVECEPAVGVVGQTMKIPCSFKTSTEVQRNDISIDVVSVYKSDQDDPVFSFPDQKGPKAPQFKLPSVNDPSLEITKTAISDEGKYKYMIVTNRGVIEDGAFWISVTAKYSKPTISSSPEVVKNGETIDLHCKASGGYPKGSIHWFDGTNTNWTKNAIQDIRKGEDNLLQLSSKLTFSQIDLSWAPFRCVVLNNKFVKEEESDFQPIIEEGPQDASKKDHDKPLSTSIVAPVVVIGSLLVGLLLLILLRGRCNRRYPPDQPYVSCESDVEKAMNPEEPKEEDNELKTKRPED